ncbi:hypothetical protein pb186bvf_008735 [Paramecium bursaria]
MKHLFQNFIYKSCSFSQIFSYNQIQMQQSIVRNLCRSHFDPKILNEVYSIYNYFKYEAGIQYSLEEVYVGLTVPGIRLMEIIFVDFLEVCNRDNLIQYKFAKKQLKILITSNSRAIRRFQLLLSWRFLFKRFYEFLDVKIDHNIELLLVSNKLDPIELRDLFYNFVKNIKFPTQRAKQQTILYQLSYDIVSQNKEHKGALRETKYYEKQEKNKKNVLKLFNWNKDPSEDTIFDELGSITDDQFDTILEFGCSQVKKVFEDEHNKIVIFKNRCIPEILFYRQDNRLYDFQGKEISELGRKMEMEMEFNIVSPPRKYYLESIQTYLLKVDPYDMTTQVLDEFYLILGDLKVLTLEDPIQNTRRILLQVLHELNEYASTTHFRYDSDLSDKFEDEIKSIESMENTQKIIKSFIIYVKSFKGKDKNDIIIPVKNLVSLPGLYRSLLVEHQDYISMLTLYDEVLRIIFMARTEKKTTQSRQEVLDSKNIQMAKLSKMEKELKQRKRLQPLDDSTEEQRHFEGVDSQVE